VTCKYTNNFYGGKEMKKVVNVFLAALLLVSLAACSKKVESAKGPAKVTIFMDGNNVVESPNIVLDALGKATNTEIDMIWVTSNDREAKLNALLAGGTLPDIFKTDVATATELKEAGLLADVSKLLPTMAPNILADVGNILSVCPVNNDGTYMIISGRKEWADQLGLRTDWLKNLGMELPTDLDSLYDVFYAFTYNDPDKNGKNDTYGLAAALDTGGHPFRSFSAIFGAYGIPRYSTIILQDGSLTTWVKHPEFVSAITYIRRLIAEGLAEPDWATIPYVDHVHKLWNGVAGAIECEAVGTTNNWYPARYVETPTPTFDFPIISGPGGIHGVPSVYSDYSSGFVFSAKADLEACLRVANFCCSIEGSDLLTLGVENEMYRWVDKSNGEVEYLGKYADPTTHRANGGYNYARLFIPINNAVLRTLNRQTQEAVAKAWANGLPNNANVIAPLQTRIDYGADMDQVIKEMYAELLGTKENVNTVYARYIREWETAGGTAWEKEVNEAWKKQGSKN
jgi:putative aldouronate transport system substrate-binding protein